MRYDINTDVADVFSEDMPSRSVEAYISPFAYGYNTETSYRDTGYSALGKFAFNLGRYYMTKYYDYNMAYDKSILMKNGVSIETAYYR